MVTQITEHLTGHQPLFDTGQAVDVLTGQTQRILRVSRAHWTKLIDKPGDKSPIFNRNLLLNPQMKESLTNNKSYLKMLLDASSLQALSMVIAASNGCFFLRSESFSRTFGKEMSIDEQR